MPKMETPNWLKKCSRKFIHGEVEGPEGKMTTLTVELPDNLAEKAKKAGLLEKDAIEAMVRETLRRQSIDELFNSADKLAASAAAPYSPEEIQQVVNAVRSQNRNRAAGT